MPLGGTEIPEGSLDRSGRRLPSADSLTYRGTPTGEKSMPVVSVIYPASGEQPSTSTTTKGLTSRSWRRSGVRPGSQEPKP